MTRRSKTAAVLVIGAQTRLAAVELRKQGKTYEAIGEKLGISAQAAHKAVMKALKKSAEREAEKTAELRDMEFKRTDAIIEALWPERSDPMVADKILKAVDLRAKLGGWHGPIKTESEVKVGDGGEILAGLLDRIAANSGAGEGSGGSQT